MLNVAIMGTARKMVYVPAGIIVPLNDTSIPVNWTRFSTPDDRLIVGAGDTFSVADTGGSITVAGFSGGSTGSAGGHNFNEGTGLFQSSETGAGSDLRGNYGPDLGSHYHAFGDFTHSPAKRKTVLIKSDRGLREFPAKAMIFSATSQAGAGLSNVTDWNSKFFESAATISNVAAASTLALGSAGDHNHGNDTNDVNFPGSLSGFKSQNAGAHTDSITPESVTADLQRVLLSLWTNASAKFFHGSGMIAMWENVTAPDGWVICDGTNGTPDLQNNFILPIGSGSENTTPTGDNTIDIAHNDNIIHSGTHDHRGTVLGTGCYTAASGHDSQAWSHTHTSNISQSGMGYIPPYYALTFIMKS